MEELRSIAIVVQVIDDFVIGVFEVYIYIYIEKKQWFSKLTKIYQVLQTAIPPGKK